MKLLRLLLTVVIISVFLIECSSYQYVKDSEYSEFSLKQKEELVAEHNKWRSKVGVPPLRWSNELEEFAKKWAHKLSKTYGCRMIHSDSSFGENIFWANYSVTPKYVVDYWAEERFYYDYSSNSCKTGKICEHYTQIVWKDTKEVGCGKALCVGKGEIWVCSYNPAGNIRGKRPF